MRSVITLSIVLLVLCGAVLSLDNGLALLPPMGYNTWCDFACKLTSQNVMDAGNAMVRQGLVKLGYNYLNVDDCWAKGRFPNGTVFADPKTFPQGIKYLADYAHSIGLKFGIYTDRGTMTCAKRPGSQGYEKIDAQTYADWGVDFLKEDSCFAPDNPKDAFPQYSLMRDSLNATGRKIMFSLCGWRSWYAPEGAKLGNLWRMAGDASSWNLCIDAVNANAKLSQYAGPGAWNDPDLLLGSANSTAWHVLPHQSRAQFSLWAVMAAPLLISANIINLNAFDMATYSNRLVIAIDQDPLGIQGSRVAGGDLVRSKPNKGQSTWNVWAKPVMPSGTVALFLMSNADAGPADVTCDPACMQRAGLKAASYQALDVWTGKTQKLQPSKGYTAKQLTAIGGHQLLLLTPSAEVVE